MKAMSEIPRFRRWATMLACVVLCWAPVSQAAELSDIDSSIQFIPRDAAFYTSFMRGGEMVEAVVESEAYASIRELEGVQMLLAQYEQMQEDPENPAAQGFQMLKSPPVQGALATLGDMFDEEAFIYGEKDVTKSLELAQQLASTMRYGPMVLAATGAADEYDPEELQAMLALSLLAENTDLMEVPGVVAGFKLAEPARAQAQIDAALGMAQMFAPEEIQQRIKKGDVGDGTYYTISLDGSMIPWDDVPVDELRDLEAVEGDADKVLDRVKAMTLVVMVGLRDDYLIVAVGPTTDVVERLGAGPLLIDEPKLKPLAKFADRRLTGVSYVSERFARKMNTTKRDLDDMLALVKELLPLAELDADAEKRVLGDARALVKDIKAMVPEAGAFLAFEFFTDSGFEGYVYNWGEQLRSDTSSPLTLVDHVGGDPVIAAMSRGKEDPEDYDLLVKWIKVGFGYFEDYAVPEMPNEEREIFEQVVEEFGPLVARADAATRNLLIPGIGDPEVGIVVDTKLTSSQFIQSLPPTEEPMPMIEPALLLTVQDEEKFIEAWKEYRSIFNDGLEALKKIAPEDEEIPVPPLPVPEEEEVAGGKMYWFPIPEGVGLDEQIRPNAAVAGGVGVITTSVDHTKRLLTATPMAMKVEGIDEPSSGAAVIDFAGLFEAAKPWIHLAADQALAENMIDPDAPTPEEEVMAEMVHSHIDVVIKASQCLRSTTTRTYKEGDAIVTRYVNTIKDIDEE